MPDQLRERRITKEAEAKVTVQRSRFFALLFPASDLDQIKMVLEKRRRKHHKARHHCWACRLRDEEGRLLEQARDDGEVGRPGMAMLELLRARGLQGAVLVTRYFGGIKLGPGGVKRAFVQAAEEALEKV